MDLNEKVSYDEEWILEVSLNPSIDFPIILDQLSRIGSKQGQEINQEVFIWHTKGRYFLVHYKELEFFDNKSLGRINNVSITRSDLKKRNSILRLLLQWNLIDTFDDSVSILCDKVKISTSELCNVSKQSKFKVIIQYPDSTYDSNFKIYNQIVVKHSEKDVYSYVPYYKFNTN